MSDCKRKKLYSVISDKCWKGKDVEDLAFSRVNEEFKYVTDKDINWILTHAVVKDDSRIIKYFAKTKIKVGADEQAGRTAIHAAIEKYTSVRRECRGNFNHLKNIHLLLDIYDETNYRNDKGLSHFHVACLVGNVKAIQNFIDRGVDVNLLCCYDGKPTTPLHLAIELKKIEAADLLLRNGADPNVRGEDGMTPLNYLYNDFIYYASIYCNRVFTFESTYHSDCEELVMKRGKFLKIIQLLISYKSDINAKDCHGNSVLFKFFRKQNYKHFFHKGALEILFQNNVDVTNVDQYGQTILHLAIARNWVRMNESYKSSHWYEDEVIAYVIEESLKLGAKVNACDYNGNTPLNLAVSYCDYKAVQLLLEHNANIQTVNFRGGFLERTNKILRNLETTQNILDIIQLLKNRGFQMNESHELLVLQFLIGFDNISQEYNPHVVLELGSFNIIQNYIDSFLRKHERSKSDKRDLHDSICCYLDALKFGKMLMKRNEYKWLKDMVKNLHRRIPESQLGYTENYCPEDVESSVKKARKTKINDCTSLLDLCTSTPEKTYALLKNSNYKKMVNGKEFTRKHDFLAGTIKGYIAKSLIRKYFKQASMKFLQLLTSNRLPVLCCEKIVNYLDNNDLLLMCELVLNEI
ncbi:hypothetical protein TKK_0008705 [Trichogramma kaykai]|uniref:PRANC domain-containing protein n=1 Tax=Trichogramma kaykai TaxID=54128 RepID=A0ABD2X5L2_9HYME